MVDIRWVWLFLHHEEGEGGGRAAAVDRAWDFWSRVTGSELSPRRGERGQFTTLVPRSGDGWVKLQRTLRGDGIHLDLVVEDVDTAADQAEHLGAERVDSYDQVRVIRSPGGFVFCFTDWSAEGRPGHQERGGRATLLHQACLDIPAELFDAETTFWSALTGWTLEQPTDDEPEFRSLRRPEGIPVRILLQRRGESGGTTTGHPDVACAARATAVAEWVAAGAEVVHDRPWWTVMRDPAGLVFCLTDRDPQTGRAG